MTQTNTDFLLQITPAVDRTYGATGANADAGGFDDHLSQAASLSGDDSRNLSSCFPRGDTARSERDDRSWNTGDSKPSSYDSGTVTSSQTSPSDQEESTDDVSGTKPPIENADSDDHDVEKADDTTAAAAAGASQGSKDNAPKSNSKPESQANANRPVAAKAAVLGKKAATNAGDQKATGKSDDQAASNASSTDTDATANIVANAATDAVNTNEELKESRDADSAGKQSKVTKSGAAKLAKGAIENSDGVVCNDSSAEGAESGEASPDVAQKAITHEAVSATQAEALATKSKSETDESSDDDSQTSSPNESRAGARNDASVQTNKVDTAQLAVSTASLTDAGVNAASKGKDGEETTKPITSKSEPPAAAFARMARNNITGPKDSTSGANDLPPIDPARFIARVAKAFHTAQDRGGTLQLRLSPPELGALRIELNVKDGVMSAALQTETANARRLLLDHLPALRDRLAEQNIRVDRFDVDVRREDTGGQSNARGSQQQQFQHQPDEPAPRRQSQPQPQAREVAAPEGIAIVPSGRNTGLNLIV